MMKIGLAGDDKVVAVETPIAADKRSKPGGSEINGVSQGFVADGFEFRTNLESRFNDTIDNPTESVLSYSHLSNLPSLLKSISKVSEENKVSIQEVWENARLYARNTLLERVKTVSESCKDDPPGFIFKESSVGLSYVIPSESRQQGCEAYERLPPVTIRPAIRTSVEIGDETIVNAMLETFKFGDTAAASFASCDEQVSKQYLLSASDREKIVNSHGGQLLHENAMIGLSHHAIDKGFICFHYNLQRDDDGHLTLGVLPGQISSLEVSNIQLAVTMKKGVGGTSGMKSEARFLDKGGFLGILLGEDPQTLLQYYNTINKIDSDPSNNAKDDISIDERLVPAEKKMALVTLCCRIDLYVNRQLWNVLSQRDLCNLMGATKMFGNEISMMIRRLNWESHMECVRSLSVETRDDYPEYMTPIFEDVNIFLDDIMGTLRERDPLDPITKQQFFLKMYVCSMAASSPRQQKAQHWAPLYMVSTRDCFSSDIVGESTMCEMQSGRYFFKTRWFIWNTDIPTNFDSIMGNLLRKTQDHSMEELILDGMVSTIVNVDKDERILPGYLLPLGITTYNGIYGSKDLDAIECSCDSLHDTALQGILPKECYHATASKRGSLKRTKYFFGSRYLWSREQLKFPDAKVAGGIRRDVPEPQLWMREMVEQPMVAAKLVPDDFVDAIALNMYHDGSEGIQSHFDDSKRFQQPIYSLRLFSDSRLSFGTQLYGFNNGLFFVPMPRGCITVMEKLGFAANGVKHCVRPIDMTGKSAAMILRKINSHALKTAEELFWREILQKLTHLSLTPASPEQLVWNPLYDSSNLELLGDSMGSRNRMKSRQAREAREAKSIKSVIHGMLKHVFYQEKKEMQRKRKIFYMISGMIKRVCTAERIGMDISEDNNCQIFNTVDDMVSFCEYPTHLKRCNKRRRHQHIHGSEVKDATKSSLA